MEGACAERGKEAVYAGLLLDVAERSDLQPKQSRPILR
jgi:hypothetical protein